MMSVRPTVERLSAIGPAAVSPGSSSTSGSPQVTTPNLDPAAAGASRAPAPRESEKSNILVQALATDYDGTLAWHSTVEYSTCTALQKLKDSGRKLILVTGRELRELFTIFSSARMFDRIVAENGGLLFEPVVERSVILGPEPPELFVDCLRQRGVHPLSVGHTIVATQEIYRAVIQDVIDELDLDWHIIPNKGALMVLPRCVDKASGLRAALRELGLEPSNVVGVGDAENDHAFLNICGWSVAVANALDSLKTRADFVTGESRGAGVEELIAAILQNKLPPRTPKLLQPDLARASLSG